MIQLLVAIKKFCVDLSNKYANAISVFLALSGLVSGAATSASKKLELSTNEIYAAVGFFITSVFLLVAMMLRSRKTQAEPLDLAAILDEVIPRAALPIPIVAELEPVLEPKFHAYASDEIDNLKWTWRWKPDATEPHPDVIEALSCFCPKCGLRIEPEDEFTVESMPTSKRHPGTLASVPRPTIAVPRARAVFACENRCFRPIRQDKELRAELRRIRHEIELRAKTLRDHAS
jgi:hypothetical protein